MGLKMVLYPERGNEMMKPTEEELKSRIEDQLEWRGATDTVALLWRGYLLALLEWRLIEISVCERLLRLLPKKGLKEWHEICLGEPIKPEHEKGIDSFLNDFNNGIVRKSEEISEAEKIERKKFLEWMKSYFESKGNKVITITRESGNQNNEP